MTGKEHDDKAFSSAGEDAVAAARVPETPQTRSPSYRLAYADEEFLLRDELRAVRLQLELLKPEILQAEHGIKSTVVIFGSTRIPDPETARRRLEDAESEARRFPDSAEAARRVAIARRVVAKSRYYDEASELARLITNDSQRSDERDFVIITGGGPGLMEAANRGAFDAGGESIGLNIVLPHEQCPNRFITPELSFQFHYFAIRKMHFLLRAKALVAFPGGFGTLDELFETLTLVQTGTVKRVPILLFGREYWQKIVDFEALAEEGTIAPEDLSLFEYVDDARAAWKAIKDFYAVSAGPTD